MKKSAYVLPAAVSAALVSMSLPAHGAFFQIAESNVSGLGNAYAGGAAIAEDASTVWYNPAGLTRLSGTQLVVAGHLIMPSLEFSRTSATTVFGAPISGGNGGDAGETALVPNVYFSHPLSDRLTFGLGVNAPFGLATDYEDSWVGRYHADRSEIKTVNVNPALAYKASDQLSIGAGVSYQMIDAELSQAVDFGSICTANGLGGVCGPTGGNDGRATVTADDDAFGFNLGVLWQVQPSTRIGAAYRSRMKYGLEGTFDITAPANVPGALLAGAGLVDSAARADVKLPATLSLSAHHALSPAWTIMADITRTYWGDLPELRIDFIGSAQADSVVTLNLKDVNRYSLGVTYTPGGNWVYRAGLALDETPTPNEVDRTPRLPDGDRTWFALGAGYKQSANLSFDLAYVYIKVDDVRVNKSTGTLPTITENTFRGNLVGEYSANTQILSAQLNWKF